MNRVDTMVNWVLDIIDSGKFKYSQDWDKRWGNGYYDCSSLMISALKQINVDVHGSTFTGNMKNIGYDKDVIIFNYGEKSLRKGDILVWHQNSNIGHTAMYIGNNRIAEAAGTKTGLRVSPFSRGKWQYVIRVEEDYVIPDYKESENNVKLGLFPELKKGSKNVYVGIAQSILKWSVDDTIEVDNSFGSHTERAVKQFYTNCGVAVTGDITKKFWELAEKTLEQFA